PARGSVRQQTRQDETVGQWTPQVGFYQPDEMDNAGGGAEVDQTVQLLPASSTQAAYPACGRRQSQRQHQRPRSHSGGNELAFGDVMQHLLDVEKLVEPDKSHQMQAAVEKRKQS